MPRYISLLSFTEQGATHLKDSPARAAAFTEAATKAGVKVRAQYWTVGSYDGVLALEADTSEQVLHYLAELVAAGNVRTDTLQAYTDAEFQAILDTQ